jgi:hypothetical protein
VGKHSPATTLQHRHHFFIGLIFGAARVPKSLYLPLAMRGDRSPRRGCGVR